MAFLTAPLARLRAIIEGSHPTVAVTGRSVPAGTLRRAVYKDDPADLEWVGIGFHRSYRLAVETTRERDGDRPNIRAGAQRKVIVVELAIGYMVSPDSPTASATVCASVEDATLLGHSDHELVAQAFRWPDFWPGTSPSIVQLRPEGDVTTSVVIPRKRVIVSARWAMTLSYAPGTAWP